MIIYILNILSIGFYGLISKKFKIKTPLICLIFIQLVMFSGLRGLNVGTDTISYLKIFNNVSPNFQVIRIFNYTVEPLFALLNGIIGWFNGSYQSLLIFSSFIINFLIFKSIVIHSSDKFLSLFLYVGLYQYYQSFNGIRQYIAVAIVLFSYKYVKKRQLSKFAICILSATSFHITAVVFIPFYFFYNKNLRLKSIAKFLGFILLFILSFSIILEIAFIYIPDYKVYESSIGQGSGGIRDIVISVLFITFGMIYGNLKSRNHLFLTLIAIAYFAFSVLALFFNANLMMRLGWYFSVFIPIYIPNIMINIKNKHKRLLMKYIIYICAFTLNLYLLSSNFHRIVPYELFVR